MDRDILILYATETGTAQHVADRIARQCHRIHVACRILSTDSYSLSDLISEPVVIFVVATTGSGIEPRSMSSMWKTLLRSDLPPDLFEDLSFALFGLGDSAYEKFCWPAKKLARRLESLGAHQLCTHTFLQIMLEVYPLPSDLSVVPSTAVPTPRVSLKQATTSPQLSTPPLGYHRTTVKCNMRITSQDWNQDVRHIECYFDDDIQYSPGDVAVIRPVAAAAEVDAFLERMGWLDVAHVPFRIERTIMDLSLPEHLPESATLRDLFTHYLDFNTIPRRSFFSYLLHFTVDELEREKIQEFLTVEGADELYEYCFRVRRTIAEVLFEFRHVKIPRDYIFDVFPPLRARHFSIASSVKAHPRQVHLCVAIVKYRTKLKVPRRGVCSTYLASLSPGDRVQIAIQSGLMQLPKGSTPIVCVGPGTGVAPMRSIIQERIHSGLCENTLYFGCRSAIKDQHYAEEWASYAARGALNYRTAFSRDGAEGVARVYVQDLVREDSHRIWELLAAGAVIFISGSSNKMPAAVKQSLCVAAEKHGDMTAEGAKDFISRIEASGRLIEECWG
ncbi:hypothetical protein C8F01DRAFT_1154064 [Mycena amicta]|nr:hypothetical protein C8F01DRAFT_1154064 [Mycena amicta]